jgi:hypothetical protein
MKIVAVNGWTHSGKDTLANILVEEYGFKRIGFADPLKDTVAEQFGFDRASLDDQNQKNLPLLNLPVSLRDGFTKNLGTFMVREFRTKDGKICKTGIFHEIDGVTDFYGVHDDGTMQKLYWTRRALCILEGSSKRTVDPDYWVKKAIELARKSGMERVVISDLRYQNETAGVKMSLEEGDTLLTVRVNRFDEHPTNSTDPSERDMDTAKFDVVIENKGTYEEYIHKAHSFAADVVKS